MKINGIKVRDYDEFLRPVRKCFKMWRWYDIPEEEEEKIKKIIDAGIDDPDNGAIIEMDGRVFKAVPASVKLINREYDEVVDIERVLDLCIRTWE